MKSIKNILFLIMGIIVSALIGTMQVNVFELEGIISIMMYSTSLSIILLILDSKITFNYIKEVLPVFLLLLIGFIFYMLLNWNSAEYSHSIITGGIYDEFGRGNIIVFNRYIITTELFVLFLFTLQGILHNCVQCKSKVYFTFLILCFALCIDGTYLFREQEVKKDHITQSRLILEYASEMGYARYYNDKDEGITYPNYFLKAEELQAQCKSIELSSINSYIRSIGIGDWETVKKIAVELQHQETVNQIDGLLKLTVKERTELRSKVITEIIREIYDYMTEESLTSYIGIYTQNNIPTTAKNKIKSIEEKIAKDYLF